MPCKDFSGYQPIDIIIIEGATPGAVDGRLARIDDAFAGCIFRASIMFSKSTPAKNHVYVMTQQGGVTSISANAQIVTPKTPTAWLTNNQRMDMCRLTVRKLDERYWMEHINVMFIGSAATYAFLYEAASHKEGYWDLNAPLLKKTLAQSLLYLQPRSCSEEPVSIEF